MATKDELTEQLSLTTKLNAAVDKMAKSAEKIEESFSSQVKILEQLSVALGKVNIDKAARDFGSLSSAAGKSSKTISDSFEEAVKNGKNFSNTINLVSKQLLTRLPKSVGIAVGALTGLVEGFRNFIALSKSALGFVSSFSSGLFNVGASILAIPLKIFTGLIDLAAQSAGGTNELLQALENVRKSFGDLNKSGSQAILKTTQTIKGFNDTGLSSWRVFGTMAERMETVLKVATAMDATFGALKKEFIDNGGAVLAFQKGLGVADEQMKSIGDRAITMGTSMSKLFLGITKQTIGLGKAFDVDQKLIGKDMAKAIADVKHFGGATVKEIGQASVYARKLGVELDKIVGTLDAFETFDSAAENAAKLSQSFGVTVDAFQLMEAQNPAEQLDMLRKQFKGAGVDASSFTRQQAKLLASSTGLDEAVVKQAFSAKNYGVSLDEIKKKSEAAEKKQMTQAEAMHELSNSIERLVKSGGPLAGGFFENFFKGMLRGVQSSKEFYGTIRNIQIALRQVYMIGIQLGRLLPKLVPGLGEFLSGWRELFTPKKWTTLFEGISKVAKDYLDPSSKNPTSISFMMQGLSDKFSEFFSSEGGSAQRILNGFKTLFKFLASTAAEGIKWIGPKIAEGLQILIDVIAGKKPLDQIGAKEKAGAGIGFLKQSLLPLFENLKNAAEFIGPKLLEFASLIVGKIVHFIKTNEKIHAIARAAIGPLLLQMFGPSVFNAAFGAIAPMLIKGAVSKITGLFGKAAAEAGVKKAAGSSLLKVLGIGTGVGAFIAAGAAIGNGVNKYAEKITSTLDRSTKVIAAGATGLIDGLTLGLLPPTFSEEIANVLATATDTIFDSIKSVFGSGFAQTLKRYVASVFDVFGGVFGLVKNLFTGDQASVDKSAKELGFSLLRLMSTALEYFVLQLPILTVRLATTVLSAVSGVVIKLVTSVGGLIASGIDKVFGTSFSDKVSSLGDSLNKNIQTLGDKAITNLSKASDVISNADKAFQEKYLRSADDRKKIAEQATKQMSDSQTSAVKKANEKLSQAFGGAAAEEIKSGVGTVTQTFSDLSKLPEVIKNATASLKGDAIKPAVQAVQGMVKLVNELDSALADSSLNKIDVRAKLASVANSVGLGGKASYTIQNKPVNITVNMTVEMNAADLEKALVMRSSSIIRDRINFATGADDRLGNGRKANSAIPERSSSPVITPVKPAD